jgi:hypothetical protein
MKLGRQDVCGDLSGFNMDWYRRLHSPNCLYGHEIRQAIPPWRPVRFQSSRCWLNCLSGHKTRNASLLRYITQFKPDRSYQSLSTRLACRDMKPVRQDFCGDLSGFIIFSISNSCSRLVCLWSLSSTTCLIWKYKGLVHYELLFQHSNFMYMECLMA